MRKIRYIALIGLIALHPAPSRAFPFYVAQVQEAQGTKPAIPVPAAPSATSVDPKAMDLAKEIVKSFDMKKMLQSMFDVMNKTMMPLITRDNPGQSQQVTDMIMDTVKKTFAAHMDEFENNKAIVYAQIYSIDELQQLKAFYQSPVGQKMIKTMPEMMQKSMLLDQNIMVESMHEAQRNVIDMLRKNNMRIPHELES